MMNSRLAYDAVPTSVDQMDSPKCQSKDLLRRKLPIVAWLPIYTWSKLIQDCLAGFTVGLTAIPQGIAYAIVAGLPAQYGLYSGFMGCFAYLLLGGSKDVTVGPTAIMAIMTQEYVTKFGEDGAVLLCFLSGSFIVVLGILQLGFLVDFISMPVTSGFTTAAAITIAVSQLKSFLGLSGTDNSFIGSLTIVFQNLSDIKLWDSLLGCVVVLLLVGLKLLKGQRTGNFCEKVKWLCCLGRNAIVVVLATLLAYILYANDIEPFKLTGAIAEGLPPFGLPPFSLTYNNQTYDFIGSIKQFGTGMVSVPLIAVLENIAIAKAFAKGRSLDATQEMLALGLSNVLGSLVRSMPVTGSFTRTAINNASGVQTQMGGVFTAAVVLVACGLLTSTFRFIPKAALAGVIIVAMYHMVDIDTFKVLWRTKKIDLVPLTVTLVTCVFWSLEYGMLIGIMVNTILLLYSTARPGVSVVEEEVDGINILLITPKQSLSYPAAEYLREQVINRCESSGVNLSVVLDGRHVHYIDATVAKNLWYLYGDLESRKQILLFWNWDADVQKILAAYNNTLAEHFRTSQTLNGCFTQVTDIPVIRMG